MNVLLNGVVGSTAYGLAHAGSDIDRLGVYAEDTENLLRLARPKESVVTTEPDVTFHEARKAITLMWACNPTVSEILWLDTYETKTPLGEELISLRKTFLSRDRVRNAYLGYAASQLGRLEIDRGCHLPPRKKERAEKHARHLVRLIRQGVQLHRTGHLTLLLEDPEKVRELGEEIARTPSKAEALFAEAEETMTTNPGVLPEESSIAPAEDWLLRVRHHYYDHQRTGAA